MIINFSKYQGAGNDFILVDGIKDNIALQEGQIKNLCDRNFGIGADGLIIAKPSSSANLFMDYYNCDGTIAEMCGNGIRCLAQFAIDTMENINTSNITIETRAGDKTIEVDNSLLKVDMGKPSFDKEAIGFDEDQDMWAYNLAIGDKNYEIYGVSMGNPHCIILEKDLTSVDINNIGPKIEKHPLFKNKINVEWANVKSKNEIDVIVWERGAGYTLACGTGACATFAVANKLGFVENIANVTLPGGTLKVELLDNKLYLIGDAKKVFQGSVEI